MSGKVHWRGFLERRKKVKYLSFYRVKNYGKKVQASLDKMFSPLTKTGMFVK